MAEQEAELPTRPSGPSACGPSASCSVIRVQTGICHRNHAAKAAGTGGLYPGGAKIPKGGAGEVEPGKDYHLRSRLSRQGTGYGGRRRERSSPMKSASTASKRSVPAPCPMKRDLTHKYNDIPTKQISPSSPKSPRQAVSPNHPSPFTATPKPLKRAKNPLFTERRGGFSRGNTPLSRIFLC